jgi:hypothetical protein
MSTIRIRLEELVDRTPVGGASIVLNVTLTPSYATIPPKFDSRSVVSVTRGPSRTVSVPVLCVERGVYQCDLNLEGARQKERWPAAFHGSFFAAVDATAIVHIVVGALDDHTYFHLPEDPIFERVVLVEFAKAIVGETTNTMSRLWFSWNGRKAVPNGTCVCEVGALPPRLGKVRAARRLPRPVLIPERTEPVRFDSGGNTANLTLEGLKAGTRYYYLLRDIRDPSDGQDGRVLATGEFTTAPDHSSSMSFAFASCHKPKPDEFGRWPALAARDDYDFLMLIGDQIYEDGIEGMWLKHKTWEEMYWNRYHQYWTCPPMREVMRRTPTYMIFDDHEVQDDWGTKKVEGNDTRPFRALAAYQDFQQAHNPGGKESTVFYYHFRRGPAAFFVLDSRSERTFPTHPNDKLVDDVNPVLGGPQWDAFRDWAKGSEAQNADIIFLIATVPIAYLPVEEVLRVLKKVGIKAGETVGAAIGTIFGVGGAILGAVIGHAAAKKALQGEIQKALYEGDMADMWTFARNQPDLSHVMSVAFNLANDVNLLEDGSKDGTRRRAVFILGGDVHAGALHEIHSQRPEHAANPTVLQIISSPISNDVLPNGSSRWLCGLIEGMVRYIKPNWESELTDFAATKYALAARRHDGETLKKLPLEIFGSRPAFFLLDDQRKKPEFWAAFRDLILERNFGRIAVATVDSTSRKYRISLELDGESRRLDWLLEVDLEVAPIEMKYVALPAGVLDGDLVQSTDGAEVYVVETGVRRLIPDEPTLLSRWRRTDVRTVPQQIIDELPRGLDWPRVPLRVAEGDLVKSPNAPEIFLIEGGRRRLIPDEPTFLSRWSWDQVKTFPPETVDALPRGSDLVSITKAGVISEGDVVKDPEHAEIFLIEGGTRRWIPDEPTLLSRWSWDQVKTFAPETIAAIPRGEDVPSVMLLSDVREGDLIRTAEHLPVFKIEAGLRRLVPSEPADASYRSLDQIKTVSPMTLVGIPRGPDVPSVAEMSAGIAEGDLIKSPDDPTIFLVQGGVRRRLPDEANLLARGSWDWVSTLPTADVEAIPLGPDLPTALVPLPEGVAEGDLIKGSDTPEVFLVTGGERRWIPDETTLLSRWSWDQVKVVPDATMAGIPPGPDLPSDRFAVLSDFGGAAVLDRKTGLVWERTPSSNGMDWEHTCEHCSASIISNRLGWRLPTIQELESLLDPTMKDGVHPAIPPDHPFNNVQPYWYWSATTSPADENQALTVDFGDADADVVPKTNQANAWCVRDGGGTGES